jgi:hypothetical protein
MGREKKLKAMRGSVNATESNEILRTICYRNATSERR